MSKQLGLRLILRSYRRLIYRLSVINLYLNKKRIVNTVYLIFHAVFINEKSMIFWTNELWTRKKRTRELTNFRFFCRTRTFELMIFDFFAELELENSWTLIIFANSNFWTNELWLSQVNSNSRTNELWLFEWTRTSELANSDILSELELEN